jgi:aminoglycoside phosphotransferase (APT) family kinase protein
LVPQAPRSEEVCDDRAVAGPSAEVDVDEALVRALLRDQHPDLARLTLTPLAAGWDNVMYRLGDDLTVRLPRRAASAYLVLHEQRWLPELAAKLPLPVPVPLRIGHPGAGYPWPWHICPWLPGRPIEHEPPDDLRAVASALGGFLHAIHRPAPPEAPVNPYRGIPLAQRADRLRDGLDLLGEEVDRSRVEAVWDMVVATPPWTSPPVWLHGDVHPLNLLVHEGALSAVIDFGDLTSGDPASDLAVAWMLFPPLVRRTFRSACGVDSDTWTRGRGWALALGVAMANGDDRMAAIGLRSIAAALAFL